MPYGGHRVALGHGAPGRVVDLLVDGGHVVIWLSTAVLFLVYLNAPAVAVRVHGAPFALRCARAPRPRRARCVAGARARRGAALPERAAGDSADARCTG
ncbi:MAG: hypothetical protein R3E53_01050 [Myxococcota bacterium]